MLANQVFYQLSSSPRNPHCQRAVDARTVDADQQQTAERRCHQPAGEVGAVESFLTPARTETSRVCHGEASPEMTTSRYGRCDGESSAKVLAGRQDDGGGSDQLVEGPSWGSRTTRSTRCSS